MNTHYLYLLDFTGECEDLIEHLTKNNKENAEEVDII